MIFTNHIDDGTCGDDSLIESHGYVIGHCFTGVGGLSGMYWSFTVTNDDTNYFLNYGFYADNECTINIFSDVETVPYGCALRGNAGGHARSKRFSTSTRIPDYKRGALFYGYGTESDCKKRKSDDKSDDILVWSFLANNQCDPHIYSPVYGPHVTDETRTCKRKSMTAVLYDSNDLSCSGAITTSTTVTKEWDCAYASVSGVDGVYPDSVCV